MLVPGRLSLLSGESLHDVFYILHQLAGRSLYSIGQLERGAEFLRFHLSSCSFYRPDALSRGTISPGSYVGSELGRKRP